MHRGFFFVLAALATLASRIATQLTLPLLFCLFSIFLGDSFAICCFSLQTPAHLVTIIKKYIFTCVFAVFLNVVFYFLCIPHVSSGLGLYVKPYIYFFYFLGHVFLPYAHFDCPLSSTFSA